MKTYNVIWTERMSVDIKANSEEWDTCENNSESVNNYLSDTYSWCVEDYELVQK